MSKKVWWQGKGGSHLFCTVCGLEGHRPLKGSRLSCLSLWVPIAVPYLETTHCNMLRGCWGSHTSIRFYPKTRTLLRGQRHPCWALKVSLSCHCPSP